jgi:alkylation response protein AidB-like acyl-CoA dehydrogenase
MELTSEQRDLREAVRGLLAQHQRRAQPVPDPAGPAVPGSAGSPGPHPAAGADQGYDAALWQRLCGEIGVAGLAIPARYGGAGAGPVETHIVMEELGRNLTPSPLLGSAVLSAQALLASGDDAACERLLPAIADGSAVAALAWTAQAGHWDPAEAACDARLTTPANSAAISPAVSPPTSAGTPSPPMSAGTPSPPMSAGTSSPPTSAGTSAAVSPAPAPPTSAGASAAGWVLAGEAHHVLDGDVAGVLLAAARTPGGIALFEVDPGHHGVTRCPVSTMDSTRRLAVVRLDQAAGRLLGDGAGRAALDRARDLACIALSAEQVGAAQRALELTVAYTKVRVQFGRAIGSFQALQHRMADLHVLVESARSLSYAAASAATGDTAGLGPRAAAAKAYCSEALARVAGQMIQLHGAIGITWEHDAHRYFKRAHGAAHLFGRPAEHIARIAAAVIDGSPGAR